MRKGMVVVMLAMSSGCAPTFWMAQSQAVIPEAGLPNKCRRVELGLSSFPFRRMAWKKGAYVDPRECGLPSVSLIKELEAKEKAAEEKAKTVDEKEKAFAAEKETLTGEIKALKEAKAALEKNRVDLEGQLRDRPLVAPAVEAH